MFFRVFYVPFISLFLRKKRQTTYLPDLLRISFFIYSVSILASAKIKCMCIGYGRSIQPYSTDVRLFTTNQLQYHLLMRIVEGIFDSMGANILLLGSGLEITYEMVVVDNRSHMIKPFHGPNGTNSTYHLYFK